MPATTEHCLCHVLGRDSCGVHSYRALEAQVAALRQALRDVGQFAACHHGDQDAMIWLHALLVDIPAIVDKSLASSTQPRIVKA